MTGPLLALTAFALLVGVALGYGLHADTSGTCASACVNTGLQMESWNGTTCTCRAPPSCQLEQRAADAATGQTSTALDLLDDCRGALVACQARGGGR